MTISYFYHEGKRGGEGGEWVPLQKLKMEERLATSLDHSLTVDYRVLCDDQSSLAFMGNY